MHLFYNEKAPVNTELEVTMIVFAMQMKTTDNSTFRHFIRTRIRSRGRSKYEPVLQGTVAFSARHLARALCNRYDFRCNSGIINLFFDSLLYDKRGYFTHFWYFSSPRNTMQLAKVSVPYFPFHKSY